MAWLQNLAGHAEKLLNQIDQNAATVLNDANNKQINDFVEIDSSFFPEPEKARISPLTILRQSRSPTPDFRYDNRLEKASEGFIPISENQKSASVNDEPNERVLPSNQTSLSSNSIQNSFLMTQELDILQNKIAMLELENQDINTQLLNIQHLYSETRNESANLQFQVERLADQLATAQSEKEQYVARAQRILQEKDSLISLKQESDNSETDVKHIFATYNEELKRELEFQQEKNVDLTQKNAKLLSDMQSLQIQHQVIQQGLNQSNQTLQQGHLSEKMQRSAVEEDCAQKTKELDLRVQELGQLQEQLRHAKNEISKLKEALLKKTEPTTVDENQIKSLTHTLMVKQNKLETTTTERNALILQLEKLEAEYKREIAELKRDRVKIINVQAASDEGIPLPNFMRVSPHDAGVTRRVKKAYSTLDAISVRTGIFLRRYPVARVFVFSYMVILHLWVLLVLLWYVPSN